MLDEYFSLDIVHQLIQDLTNNPRYNSKTIHKDSNYGIHITKYLGLYILYEAIYKYKVIIDDVYLFEDYVEQIDKLFRKMNDFDDISMGINQLLCNYVSIILDIHDIQLEDNKKEIVSYLYQKYLVDGYYVHGFPTVYEKQIFQNGFDTENYKNHYIEMMKIDSIFRSHGISNVFQKDFQNKVSYFTDDFVMGCYYSSIAPCYLSKFLTNPKFIRKGKIEDFVCSDFSPFEDDLKSYFTTNFSDTEANYVLKTIKNEWDSLYGVPKRISLMLVPRKIISTSIPGFHEYYQKNGNLYEMVDRILSPKSRNISFSGKIDSSHIQIFSFYFPKTNCVKAEKEIIHKKELEKVEKISIFKRMKMLNTYGVISIFIVAGSCFITLGIIISIIMILRGM